MVQSMGLAKQALKAYNPKNLFKFFESGVCGHALEFGSPRLAGVD